MNNITYTRKEYQTLLKRIVEPRRFIQVMMGPRQVGKSTLARQVLDSIITPWQFYSADDVPATRREWISECWEKARLWMRTHAADELVLVIDEIQKLRNWSEVVKKEYDADTFNRVNIKVVLLGSSRVMLEKGLSESLHGRYEEIRLPHWSFTEMHDAFGTSLEQYIFFGGYPGAADFTDDEERWRFYIGSAIADATINKDILMDSPVSKPALLRQTFELSSAYSGRILSLTKMVGALQDAGNTTTLSGYLELLSQSGLVTGLQKYSIDQSRQRASIPKFQVFNNALCSLYAGARYEEAIADHSLWGHIFESAIGTHILNTAFVRRYQVFYWRDGNDEVDFILKKGQRIVAIEVKSNAEKATAGLDTFRRKFAPHAAFIVGSGGIPAEEFLSMDLAQLF